MRAGVSPVTAVSVHGVPHEPYYTPKKNICANLPFNALAELPRDVGCVHDFGVLGDLRPAPQDRRTELVPISIPVALRDLVQPRPVASLAEAGGRVYGVNLSGTHYRFTLTRPFSSTLI